MSSPEPVIQISLADQRLTLMQGEEALARFSVSTALRGGGERAGSLCTPRGVHVVRAKIGAGLASGAVFVARRPTGEIWDESLHARHPGRDWVLTRILWLSGCEVGRNRLGEVDTMRRYIYIHGTPDVEPLGQPRSHGCIRMANQDVIALFAAVPVGISVRIVG